MKFQTNTVKIRKFKNYQRCILCKRLSLSSRWFNRDVFWWFTYRCDCNFTKFFYLLLTAIIVVIFTVHYMFIIRINLKCYRNLKLVPQLISIFFCIIQYFTSIISLIISVFISLLGFAACKSRKIGSFNFFFTCDSVFVPIISAIA